jgi:hypothetical protein
MQFRWCAGCRRRHVAAWLLPGQADHLLGEQPDRHGLAHVERVDRLVRANCGSLQDQQAGLKSS